jgi:hypothetical protein
MAGSWYIEDLEEGLQLMTTLSASRIHIHCLSLISYQYRLLHRSKILDMIQPSSTNTLVVTPTANCSFTPAPINMHAILESFLISRPALEEQHTFGRRIQFVGKDVARGLGDMAPVVD